MAATPKTAYKDIKDISLTDFLDVETEQTVVAHDIWKNKATVVIGKRHSDSFFQRQQTQPFTPSLSHHPFSFGIERVRVHTDCIHSFSSFSTLHLTGIFVVIRRPGCQFCREEAKILDGYRNTIEQGMVRRLLLVLVLVILLNPVHCLT